MGSLVLAIGVVIAVYLGLVLLMPKRIAGAGGFAERTLSRLEMEAPVDPDDPRAFLKNGLTETTAIVQATFNLPFMSSLESMVVKAGLGAKRGAFLIAMLVVFLLASLLLAKAGMGAFAVIPALPIGYFLPWLYARRRIRKRNDAFINMFPDALDMIVRSVKSGFPLNTALKMIADNTVEPLQSEFRQVVEEIAYGRTLTDALARLGQRIDEPDIQFFVVVLTVQQEAGGNLAEIIGNLSNIIRKRKQLRLKIKALTSEGRATAWVLGAIPVLVFFALFFLSPGHLEPLWTTLTGNIVFGTACGLIIAAIVIVYNMLDIDI